MTAMARTHGIALGALALLTGALLAPAAQARDYPISASQRATAQQVATRGVPVAELAANAPETYVVKRGDTLWAISGMYLKRPWRWPELWGMNLQAIKNPHLIYPGQTLYLEKSGGYARLRSGRPGELETVRLSPMTRYESLANAALPTIQSHLIEPFLVEPQVVDELTLQQAPRIVATRNQRVIMANGDRAYVRGPQGSPLELAPNVPRTYNVYHDVTPMKDPQTGEILGYEAQYVGQAELVRSESEQETPDGKGNAYVDVVPATVDLSRVKEEVRIGDRLLPAPARTFSNYVPHAPEKAVDASVVSIYGSEAVRYAGNNNVVAINRGSEDGMEPGVVLQLLTEGRRMTDKTDADRPQIRLPNEANGLAMVFRTFERVSYALVLQASQPINVGDRLVSPE